MKNRATQPGDAALAKIIAAAGLHPLMSNPKWVKLLTALIANYQLIKECKIKLIWEDERVERWLLLNEDTSYNFDYYVHALEAMITGKPRGWYVYKEIEWLYFPRLTTDKGEPQAVTIIQQKIEEVGCFQLELSPDGLRLYAYQRP